MRPSPGVRAALRPTTRALPTSHRRSPRGCSASLPNTWTPPSLSPGRPGAWGFLSPGSGQCPGPGALPAELELGLWEPSRGALSLRVAHATEGASGCSDTAAVPQEQRLGPHESQATHFSWPPPLGPGKRRPVYGTVPRSTSQRGRLHPGRDLGGEFSHLHPHSHRQRPC